MIADQAALQFPSNNIVQADDTAHWIGTMGYQRIAPSHRLDATRFSSNPPFSCRVRNIVQITANRRADQIETVRRLNVIATTTTRTRCAARSKEDSMRPSSSWPIRCSCNPSKRFFQTHLLTFFSAPESRLSRFLVLNLCDGYV